MVPRVLQATGAFRRSDRRYSGVAACQSLRAALALRAKTLEETPMATHKLLLLPGDGIGPEVMAEVKRLIDWLDAKGIAKFETEKGFFGGPAYDAHKVAISEADMAKAKAADAIIFGAVGGPKWDSVPYEARPEAGLLRLRKDLGLFANLRAAVFFPALWGGS